MIDAGIDVQTSKVTVLKSGSTHNFCYICKIGFIQGLVKDTLRSEGYILKAVVQQYEAKSARIDLSNSTCPTIIAMIMA